MPQRDSDRWDLYFKPINVYMDENVSYHSLFVRSLFGKILLYNRLTQSIVDETSIAKFQSRLTAIAKNRCLRGNANWYHKFHSVIDMQFAGI